MKIAVSANSGVGESNANQTDVILYRVVGAFERS